MKQFFKFKIFGDDTIGRVFMPDGIPYSAENTFIPSIIHGRSMAVKVSDYEWILVKGGGWNYGGPTIYTSKKDEELIFGLNPYESGLRELTISKQIEKVSDDFPKVLYLKKFRDFPMPKEYDFLKIIRFTNGKLVDPCLTYTQVKCPYRVLDLAYLPPSEKEDTLLLCCRYWNIQIEHYLSIFAKKLGQHVGILHKNGFINDTLEYSNVTLLAEIVDYEFITAPGVPFLDGTDGTIIPTERREKEILYGSEILVQLSSLIYHSISLYDAYHLFIEGYRMENPLYIENNMTIQKILNRERIIL